MNTIFKVMLFSIMLNFATGIMMSALPDLGSNPQYNMNIEGADMNGAVFIGGMNQTISPSPDTSNSFFRLIDSLNIGIISKLLTTMNSYFYGFINLICNVFGLEQAIRDLFGNIVSICYIIGAFWLWTGKDITA